MLTDSTHLHNVCKVQIFMENELLRSVLQPFRSAQTLSHKLLKAHTGFTASLSTATAFQYFWRAPRMMTYTPNKAKTLQNPHLSGESNSWNVSQATPHVNNHDGTRGRANYSRILSRNKPYNPTLTGCIDSAHGWIEVTGA